MGLIKDIKTGALNAHMPIGSDIERDIQSEINKLFYLDPGPKRELAFVGQMFTRGADQAERTGLHASAIIVSDDVFCIRQQVLSLLYKQLQGEQVPVRLKRIFMAGDYIHEKYQRLFLRGGWCEPDDLDYTCYDQRYELSYTPDAIVRIQNVFGDDRCVVEIKSVNTYTFKEMQEHPSGKKQCLLYMRLTGCKHGIVLCEDKNTQDMRVFYYAWPGRGGAYEDQTEVFMRRLEDIQAKKRRVLGEGRIPKRHCKCSSIMSEKAKTCPMRDVCFGIRKERL